MRLSTGPLYYLKVSGTSIKSVEHDTHVAKPSHRLLPIGDSRYANWHSFPASRA